MRAPKIIHQIWLQGWENVPDKYRKNIDRLHTLNPDFTFKQWDEKSLQAECAKLGQEYLDKFNSFDLLMLKVEFGRYVVLYNYGGISVDTDMFSLKTIESLPDLDHDFIVSGSAFPANMVIKTNNALIITTKHNYILKDLIDTIVSSKHKRKDYLTKELYINSTTGPNAFVSIIKKYPEAYILDHKYFEPCLSVDLLCRTKEDSIMDHQHEMSWINPFFKVLFTIIIFFMRNWWILLALPAFYFRKQIMKIIYKSWPTSKRR